MNMHLNHFSTSPFVVIISIVCDDNDVFLSYFLYNSPRVNLMAQYRLYV